jgi:hypothetical protein
MLESHRRARASDRYSSSGLLAAARDRGGAPPRRRARGRRRAAVLATPARGWDYRTRVRPEQPRGSPPRARNYYHRFGLRGWRSQLPRPQAAAAGQAGGKQAGGLHNCVNISHQQRLPC